MHQVAQFLFCSLIGLALYNTLWAVMMAFTLRRKAVRPADDQLPKAAVFLCLRGADPSLASCLRRLMIQDYPDYDIFVVVDSQRDPAWQIVQQEIRRSGATNVHVSPLRLRRKTCSLKCSSLVQMLDQVDASHEVILLADADLESHSNWMRELVAPLADPRVGAAFGNRWFVPTDCRIGSLVRQMWNAPGVVVMKSLQIPWAGSLALRASVIEQSKLRDMWAHSIVDDGPVRTAVKAQGMKLQFVPSLVMANREGCDLAFAYNFLRRQLTWTRTYVRGWWSAMMIYNLLSVGMWSAAVVLAIVCFVRGDTSDGVLFASGATIVALVLPLLAVWFDFSARTVIRRQGESTARLKLGHWTRMPLAISLAGSMNLFASVAATFSKRIIWRGVTYEIRGPWDIRMLDDAKPQPMPTTASSVSI